MTATAAPLVAPEAALMDVAARAMGAGPAARVAEVLRALAEPLRLRMLSIIVSSPTGEACARDLATVAEVSQPTVSHHLKVLKEVGVLTSERRGTWVFYRVAPESRRAVTALLEGFVPSAIAGAATDMAGLTDVDGVLDRMATRFIAQYPGLQAGHVRHTVRESYTALARRAGVRTHLVATTERFARQRLDDVLRAGLVAAGGGTRTPQVLFVCVANAGRSQLAAALMQHHAGDAVIVRSAGSAPADDVHGTVRDLLAEIGADAIESAYPKPLTDDAVRAADVVVTMGCGDTCPVLPGVRYEDWAVGDPSLASPEGVIAIRDEIDRRVQALLADLVPAT